jgi:dTMP kinase
MYQSPQGHSCHIVALEGGDRLGKSTQARLLEPALERAKIRGILDKSPYKDGATYDRIYEMLGTGDATRHPVVFQTLYAANRRFFQHRFLPTLAGHFDVVVLDRWILSGLVYGAQAGIPDDVQACIQHGLVVPDLTLVFDGQPFPAPDDDDSYEADQGFQQRIRDGFRSWAQQRPDQALVVGANRPEKIVCAELVGAIQRLLGR